MSVVDSECSDSDTVSKEDSKDFITKILGEMKNQFNMTDKKLNNQNLEDKDDLKISESDDAAKEVPCENKEMNSSDELINGECKIGNESSIADTRNDASEADEQESKEVSKPRIVLLFKKPNVEPSKCKTSPIDSPSKRSLRNKPVSFEEVQEFQSTLKRSARRRSKDCNESVLQSAIARKEKSYNESSKPQRLTRRLKPTPKILENLAAARLEKTRTDKNSKHQKSNDKSSDRFKHSELWEESSNLETSDDGVVNKKHKIDKSRKRIKHSKYPYESNQSSEYSYESSPNAKLSEPTFRRSERISISRKDSNLDEKECSIPEPTVSEQSVGLSAEPECSSVTDQLIASRLCLCTKTNQLYPYIDDEEIYCGAVDSVGEKLVGCTKIVNQDTPLLRPSNRVPFSPFCEVHRNRLVRHNCCPTCGVFCTQGRFVQCESQHQYHRSCQIAVGDVRCCPHCGLTTPDYDIYITMHSAKKPVFLLSQKPTRIVSKITFTGYSGAPESDKTSEPILPFGTLDLLHAPELIGQEFDFSELFDAVSDNDIERVAIILGSRSVDLSKTIPDCDDGTILHFAAQNGLILTVHMLVVVGIQLDVFDREQNTPLTCAIVAERNEVVEYLIKAGASIEIKGTDGMTALHVAAKCGNITACNILLKKHAGIIDYINAQDDGGWTPLVWACENGFVEIAQFLIENGADPLLRDVEHNIALHWAAFSGCSQIAELLLNNNSDVNAINTHGDTPLHIGARQDMYNCITVLLARGADVSVINNNNETPLDCVPPNGDSYNIISLNVQLQGVNSQDCEPKKYILTNDISKGRENNPIQCVNHLDGSDKPNDYVYITKNCYTSNSFHPDLSIASRQSCTCGDRCRTESCECSKMTRIRYDSHGKIVLEHVLNGSPMIFECNETCNCNSITCSNRIVQKGLTQRFQLLKTPQKGWGIITLKAIAKGSFVCEYVGEIITESAVAKREDDSYLFDLDNKELNSYCIDAKFFGNFSRFINHSCNPNLFPMKVFIEHHDLRFPRIAFFASRDIGANEELCFDYGRKFWEVKAKLLTCHCGNEDCRYLSQKLL